MKDKGLRKTANAKDKIERKLSKPWPKCAKFWRLWSVGSGGLNKLRLLLQKACHLSHFA